MRSIAACCLVLIAGVTYADEQPRPDRKDYAIEAIERQRNEALNREAMCRADLMPEIDRLRARVAELEKAVGEKKE